MFCQNCQRVAQLPDLEVVNRLPFQSTVNWKLVGIGGAMLGYGAVTWKKTNNSVPRAFRV